jgi:hypothetical protein
MVDHPDSIEQNPVTFDAKRDTALSADELCADANAIIGAERSYEENNNGTVRYDPFGVIAPNSNSFARYLFTFAPNLGKITPSKRARGWNHKLLGR